MTDRERLIDRLQNWKFEQALDYCEPEAEYLELVEALAATFGNCGWFGGKMGVIVDAAISVITAEIEVESDAGTSEASEA